MKITVSKQMVRSIFSRVWILYLAAVVFFFCFLNFEKLFNKAKAATLSRLIPANFDYLIELEKNPAIIDKKQIAPYIHYYEKVAAFVPQLSDTHSLLGFSYYQLGAEKKAMASLRRAMALNPDFLINYYNLGLIYFKKKMYKEATFYFHKATKTSPPNYLEFVSSSRLFFPLFLNTEMGVLGRDLVHKLKVRYFSTYYLLALSYFHQEKYPEMLNFSLEALGKADEHGIFYYFAGLAAYHMKEYSDAVLFFQKSLELNPQFAEALHYLGLTWEVQGKTEMSRKALQGAVYLRQQGAETILPEEKDFHLFLY